MPRSSAVTRQRIFETAYRLFYQRGFNRVGMDEVAAAAGVTKRTLYYHFDSKDELLAAVLDAHHELALARIRTWADRSFTSTRKAIDELFADFAKWAATPRWTGSGFTRLAMELADLPGHPARAVAKRHKAAVEAILAERLREAKLPAAPVRAREIALLLEGANALMLIHGDHSYAKAAAGAAKRLMRTTST